MHALESHRLIFTCYEFVNGLPAKFIYKWSAWNIVADSGRRNSSSVLKCIKLNFEMYQAQLGQQNPCRTKIC